MSTEEQKAAARNAGLRQWLKNGDHPFARLFRTLYYGIRHASMPVIPGVHIGLYHLHTRTKNTLISLISKLYWTPLFRARLATSGSGLLLVGSGLPLVTGPLTIRCGKNCRISTHVTFSARTSSHPAPILEIGDQVGIGWQTTIACGTRVVLGDNVRIAGSAFIAGYAGHPLNAHDRALGLPDTEAQIGDVIIEEDVWLGTGVKVMSGVRIGKGTVVAAGSIVTKDLPAGVLAAGSPAKVLRSIEDKQ